MQATDLHRLGQPPGAGSALDALWWAAHDDWGRAHACAQAGEGTPDADWVHAYLHRAEGDLANAGYWYARAGRPQPTGSLDQEWHDIATALLGEARDANGTGGS